MFHRLARITCVILAITLATLGIIKITSSQITADSALVTVAAWNYTSAPTSASVLATGGSAVSGAVLTNFKNAIPTYSTSSLNINGWDNGSGTKYWQVSLSTKNCHNLTLSAQTRSSGTGPRDFQVIYSRDNGSNWTVIPGSDYKITSTTLQNNLPNEILALPSDTEDVDNLIIRFQMTSNISSRAGISTFPATETVASGGTSNINKIILMSK